MVVVAAGNLKEKNKTKIAINDIEIFSRISTLYDTKYTLV